MYRIRAGLMFGLDKEKLISQEDLDWYKDISENADADTVREINRRGDVHSRNLVEYRDSLEGDDIEKKNYDASWSDDALALDILSEIRRDVFDSPGNEVVSQEITDETMRRKGEPTEQEKINALANKINDANFIHPYANQKRNRYARTKVSPEQFELQNAQRLDRFRQIALGGKKQNRQPAGKSQNLIHNDDGPEFLIHEDVEPVDLLGSEPDPENLFSNNNALITFLDKNPLPRKGKGPISQPAPKPAPRSKYAADYDLLSSQEGSEEERRRAYDHMAGDTIGNLTDPQKNSIRSYIKGSEPINSYLRNDPSNSEYPLKRQIPKVQEDIKNISEGLKNNPLQENLSAYKGITDKYLAMMFQQFGLKKALNKDGTINHKWLRDNQQKMKKTLVGKTFHDKGYTWCGSTCPRGPTPPSLTGHLIMIKRTPATGMTSGRSWWTRAAALRSATSESWKIPTPTSW